MATTNKEVRRATWFKQQGFTTMAERYNTDYKGYALWIYTLDDSGDINCEPDAILVRDNCGNWTLHNLYLKADMLAKFEDAYMEDFVKV